MSKLLQSNLGLKPQDLDHGSQVIQIWFNGSFPFTPSCSCEVSCTVIKQKLFASSCFHNFQCYTARSIHSTLYSARYSPHTLFTPTLHSTLHTLHATTANTKVSQTLRLPCKMLRLPRTRTLSTHDAPRMPCNLISTLSPLDMP